MPADFDKLTAVVLAGGYGARLRGVLQDLPKPMAPVGGRPFVEWVIRYLGMQGIGRVILSTGYLGESIESHFTAQPVPGVEVRCAREKAPLGTAGGFLNAIRQTHEAPSGWLVVNGDSLVLADLSGLTEALESNDTAGSLLGVRVPDASRFGTITQDDRGNLKEFIEKQPGSGVINAGVYFFRNATIGYFPDWLPLSFESDVFPALLKANCRLKVLVENVPFIDIGTPETLAQAEYFIDVNGSAFLSGRQTRDEERRSL